MSQIKRNILYNGFGQLASLLLGFVAVRFVFRKLGGDALGLIYFAQTLSVALTIGLQLGICESAVREVASHHSDRPDYIKSLIRTSSLLYWAAYLALGVVSYIAAPYLVHHWVKLNTMDASTATKMMRILTLGALVALPGGLYRALLPGLQHMGITNLIDVAGKALQQAGIFLILLMHGSLFQVACWIAFSTLVPVAVYWVVCAHYFSVRALLLPGFSLAVVKENAGYASGLMTITLCSWVLGQADKVIISKVLPLALLGIYTFARSAINQGMLLTSAISNAMFPHFAALHGAGKTDEMKRAYSRIHDLICFGTIPVFAGVPFVALPVFSHVFDVRSAHALLLPSTLLCIGYYMNGTLTMPYMVSLAMRRQDIAVRQNLVALLIVPPIDLIAIHWFGLNGAGLSWVIYHVYAYSYGLPRICRECIGISPRTWYWQIFRIMGPALIIYGSAWAVVDWIGNFSIPALAVAYGMGTILYCGAVFGTMDGSLRVTILQYLAQGRERFLQADGTV